MDEKVLLLLYALLQRAT